MLDLGRRNVLGVLISANDYDAAVTDIVAAAEDGRGYAVSALAIHGVMTTVRDPAHRGRLNDFDMVTADGQGVRWVLNLLHRTGLADRVYGPELMWRVCVACAERGIPVYLYGSREPVVDALARNLRAGIPGLQVAGSAPSLFRTTTREEQEAIAARIRESGAGVVFVGLGCPRQEVFVHEYHDLVERPMLAVGAAFDYHAGLLAPPPAWAQRWGLHGLYRMTQEPRRTWRRFLLLPFGFLALAALQLARVWRPDPGAVAHPDAIRYG